MLVVCSNKDLHGFTYGRLYVFTYDPDLFDTGYTWVKNDKGVIVGEPASNFRSLTDWKKTIQNRNAILWALTSGVL
jgi:hypothetical protein